MPGICAKANMLFVIIKGGSVLINPAIPGKDYYGSWHAAQIEDFVDACLAGRPPFVTARSAGHAVQVVLAVYAAHHSGGWISLNQQ